MKNEEAMARQELHQAIEQATTEQIYILRRLILEILR